MLRAFQIFVGREEKARKVPEKDIIKGEQRVKEQGVDVLESLQARAGLVGRKAKNLASRQRVVFTLEVDAGVVAPMVEDTPHVRADSTNIERIVQDFVDRSHRRDRIVIAVVRDIQQKECLGESA